MYYKDQVRSQSNASLRAVSAGKFALHVKGHETVSVSERTLRQCLPGHIFQYVKGDGSLSRINIYEQTLRRILRTEEANRVQDAPGKPEPNGYVYLGF